MLQKVVQGTSPKIQYRTTDIKYKNEFGEMKTASSRRERDSYNFDKCI